VAAALEPPPRGAHDPPNTRPFHTHRGRMPLRAWLRYPAARRRERRGEMPERPWIPPAAIGWMRRRMRRDWRVLELGSGRSTPWLARRCETLVSFEDNPEWLTRTAARLTELGLDNVDLRLIPIEDFPREVAVLPDESFDLVFVDFLEAPAVTRVDCVHPGREKVRPGGYLVLDDSDRPGYAEAYELLAGWRRRRLAGIKDQSPAAGEATAFRRPLNK
jgi:predicted O-methyltransferase YrrM